MKNQVDYILQNGTDGKKEIHILVNGIDISDCVVAASFKGEYGEAPFVYLKCIAHKIAVDGDENANIHR